MTGWKVRLSDRAARDIEEILAWTAERFGAQQAQIYAAIIGDALTALAAGPQVVGVRARPELGEGIESLHVARHGCKGRHVVFFRARESEAVIDVLRILHDSMEPQWHLSGHVKGARHI
jgi:toxin ParE1/3/4